jgi:MFS transporter, DHA2 family, glioxin efflux transporter
MGGAFCVSGAQSGFQNTLLKNLPKTSPGINPFAVLAVGATELRKTFTSAQIPGILESYMDGLKVTFITATALAGASVVVSLASKWVKIKG